MGILHNLKIPRYFRCRLVALAFLLTLVQSCHVNLIAAQDQQILDQIDQASREINTFYLQMADAATTDYKAYSNQYIAIEVLLNAIYDQSRLKAKNVETARIAKNVRDTWAKYRSEHKESKTLSTGVITYNHTTISDFLYVLAVAENAKPK